VAHIESYHFGLAGIREEGQAGRRDGCRVIRFTILELMLA
jgi:hypothetical protein